MRLRWILLGLVIAALIAPSFWQAAPALAQGGTTHVVQSGENLYRISLKYGLSWPVVAAANGITNPNLIFVGQTLVIPAAGTVVTPVPGTPAAATAIPATAVPATAQPQGGQYSVKAGDNLFRIAAQFGTTVAALVQANNIVNPNLIYVGQVLTIPGTTPVPQPTAAPQATPVPGATQAPQPTVAPQATAAPQPTAAPQATVAPQPTGTFELGAHVENFRAPDLMRQAKMTWVKRQVRYNLGDNPDATAGVIAEAHSQGFRVLLSVVGDPAQLGSGGDGYMDQYAGFVGRIAALGPDAIEIWNEMNLDREWPRGQIDPNMYVRMLSKSYAAIKAANPSVMVISGAPSPTGAEGAFGTDRVWNDDRYIRGMAAAGAASYADCIGAHYNEGIVSPTQSTGDPRDNYYTRYYSGMVSTYSAAFGSARPLCFTELGYLSPEGLGSAPAGFEWANNTSVAEQALWLGQAAQLSRSNGRVRLMIVWNMDFTGYGADPLAGYAIIRPDNSCPACQQLGAAMQ